MVLGMVNESVLACTKSAVGGIWCMERGHAMVKLERRGGSGGGAGRIDVPIDKSRVYALNETSTDHLVNSGSAPPLWRLVRDFKLENPPSLSGLAVGIMHLDTSSL